MNHSSFRQYKRDRSRATHVKPLTFQLMVLAIVLLAVFCVILLFIAGANNTSDTRVHDVFVDQARAEFTKARESASQFSRTGGSNTQRLLAQTRQHLYALMQLNTLSTALIDNTKPLLVSDPINDAISNLDASEARLMEGKAIDEPLNALINNLDLIAADVQGLV